jgi:hypothetical protein
VRRYAPLRQSIGTVIPLAVRREVLARDAGCVGPAVGMDLHCAGGIELDHVEASHGMGMKSRTTADNLVSLCGLHHRIRTESGRIWRPKLLAYLATVS